MSSIGELVVPNNSKLYAALPGAKAIRLLEVAASNDADPLTCNLRVVEDLMANSVEYHALSYCWGDTLDPVEISCNGKPLYVTQNLHRALKRLHADAIVQLVWVDAICINQHDTAERNQQVSMIRQIYSRATEVLVWLGMGNEKISRAAEAVQEVGDEICAWYYGPEHRRSWPQKLSEETDLTDLARYPLHSDSCAEYGRKLLPFYSYEWFQRIWVIKEVQSNRRVWLLYDDKKRIWWPTVAVVVRWMAQLRQTGEIDVDAAAFSALDRRSWAWKTAFAPQAEMMTRKALWTRCREPFLQLLHRTRCFRSSDPRDMVFAMLRHPVQSTHPGPADSGQESGGSESTNLGIVADYSKITTDVYLDAAIQSIEQSRTLEVLSYYWRAQPEAPDGQNWVPQWNVDCTDSLFPLPTWRYNADVGRPCELSFGSSGLRLRGIRLGVVTDVGLVLQSGLDESRGVTDDASSLSVDSLIMLARLALHNRYEEEESNPHDQGSSLQMADDVHVRFEDFLAWLTTHALNNQTSNTFFASAKSCFCDHCNNIISDRTKAITEPSRMYSCLVCLGGEYEMCTHCHDAGLQCPGQHHDLIGRTAMGFRLQRNEIETFLYSNRGRWSGSGSAQRFLRALRFTTRQRKWLRTDIGHLASGPRATQLGDVVVVLFGARVPFLLRPQRDGRYRLIGDCYVDGMMDGEAVEMAECGELAVEGFELC